MTLNYSTPVVNPRLASSFAIFASTYICLVLMLIILEQLGLATVTIDQLILVMPVAFYVAIGFITRTINIEDYFVSGHRVPAFYTALALCAAIFGGTLLLGTIGTFFFVGIDALALPIGCFLGIVLMAVLFVPYLRKAAAYTLPGFLYLRFGNRGPRVAASLFAIVPCLLIVLAELSLGSSALKAIIPAADLPIDLPPGAFFAALVCGSVFLTVFFGGTRSATWTQCAQFIVMLGLLVPLVTVSVMRTNLPLPQLTYGGQLELIKAQEASKGIVTSSTPRPLEEVIPDQAAHPITRPVERAFSAFTAQSFVLLIFCLAAGIASHPAFLPRLSATPSILSSRLALGWATVIAALLVLTIPAYAVFTRAMAIEGLIGVSSADIPGWGRMLQQLGFASLPASQFDSLARPASVAFERDTVAFILPIAARLPHVFLGLMAASALAALSASASAQILALANTVSDDLYHGFLRPSGSHSQRLLISRLSIIGFGVFAFMAMQSRQFDPLRLVLQAMSLSASTFFAALVLSIWWRRFTSLGAIAAMAAGFVMAGFYQLNGLSFLGVDALTAAAIGVPVSFGAGIAASVVSGAPSAQALETADDLRIPAGETLHSRMLRLSARNKTNRASG